MGAHTQEEHLVGLSRPVDAHVGQRRGRQEAAEGVERLGPDRLAVDEVGVTRLPGMPDGQPGLGRLQQLAVGVEHPVHVAHVPGAERRVEQTRVPVVAVVTGGEALVVGDVAGRLLEVGHQPAPLENLGQQVRRLFASQVDPAQLGHGVVPVLEEDLLVEILGPGQPDGGVHGGVPGDVQLPDELVEEQSPQALRRAGVPGEQGTLDHFWQVDQGEHRPVEVGDVTAEDVCLVSAERLHGIGEHARITLRRHRRVRRGPQPRRVVGAHHPPPEERPRPAGPRPWCPDRRPPGRAGGPDRSPGGHCARSPRGRRRSR